MPEVAEPAARVQLCGAFVVELSGRRIDHALPGRQGRLLFAYLALSRHERVARDTLVDALWGESPPNSAGALNALISKVRAAAGPDVVLGRSQLQVMLPEPAVVDVEIAAERVHVAEAAVAQGQWRRAWSPALSAQFVARRPFLSEADLPWAEAWRRRLAGIRVRALEAYATACLHIGGTELAGAERAARELVELVPLRETAHLLLMRSLAARGNVAEALHAYESLRVALREELGVNPCREVQDAYAQLLR